MDVSALTDEELALALQSGDERAFNELVRRHQGRVYAVAYRVTSNREDALDVTQEVLVKAYRKIDTWRPTNGLLPWLMRLTINHSIDMLRRGKRHQHAPLDESFKKGGGSTAIEPSQEDTGRDVRSNEIEERVQKALGVLSPAQRSVFVMRHYEGMQLADIAVALGCTTGSVKVHLFRALKKMQEELKDLHQA
jgi:RNA polymerase sigma-70 factor (ECF subfamily)